MFFLVLIIKKRFLKMAKAKTPKQLAIKIRSLNKQVSKLEKQRKRALAKPKKKKVVMKKTKRKVARKKKRR